MFVSIITVAYNAERTILDTVKSVNWQHHNDYEHIIIDGNSQDRTRNIVLENRTDHTVLVSENDAGIFDAMNKGVRLAKGDLIGFLNADDFFARTDALSLLAAAGTSDRHAAAVCGAVAMVDPRNSLQARRNYRSTGFHPWMLRFGHMPPHPGFYVRRGALERVGAFDPSIRTGADFEWMLRFFHVHKLAMLSIPETVVGFRLGGNSTRGLASLRNINSEALASCRRWGLSTHPAAIWAKYLIKSGQFFDRSADFPLAPPIGFNPSWP